jgi:hypothetical protein
LSPGVFFVLPVLTFPHSTSSEPSTRWMGIVAAQARRAERRKGIIESLISPESQCDLSAYSSSA